MGEPVIQLCELAAIGAGVGGENRIGEHLQGQMMFAEGEVVAGLTAIAGKEITIANIILPSGGIAGLVICKSLEYNDSREAMRKATITATMYPLIPP